MRSFSFLMVLFRVVGTLRLLEAAEAVGRMCSAVCY